MRGFLRPPRRRRRRMLICALLALAASWALSAPGYATVTTESGFEVADGNLAPNPAGQNFDWNSFSPVTWSTTPAAPYREATKTFNGWAFKGFEDDADDQTDTGFAGGQKQDDDCAKLDPGKPPNKDELTRIYLSTKIVGGDTFLTLAWSRFDQNSVTASAHVGFEFNQNRLTGTGADVQPCGGGSPLVKRKGGDMLIVYDFEGGEALPVIKLSRWLNSSFAPTGATCEVNNSTIAKGCWGDTKNLTTLGFAEALVNTFGGVTDDIKPPGASDQGEVEFGEAGINLTDAGVFGSNVCQGFGRVYGVSRSSGNSQQAAMMDLVGPGDFSISNCGTASITKVDDSGAAVSGITFTAYFPDGVNASNVPTGTAAGSCTTGASGTCSILNLPAGTYTIDETVPASSGYVKDPTFPKTGVVITAGGTTNVSATNPRTFRTIVIVCNEVTDTLYPSDITIDTSVRPDSLSSTQAATAGLSAADQTAICGLTAGARGGLRAEPNPSSTTDANPHDADIDIPNSQGP